MAAPKPVRRVRHWLALAPRWWRSRRAARGRSFDEVETFCLFAGYPRSGHSLVGSLLDAHPDATIAHELHVLRYVKYGYSRAQIFTMLVDNAREHAEAGKEVTGYRYAVPGQWQGRHRTLRVLGDKRGGTTIRKLRARPWLLPRLRRKIGRPIRWIHVTRNPFDNIATIHRRGRGRSLEESVEHYFGMVEGVAWLKAQLEGEEAMRDVRHEDLLARPAEVLEELCELLGLEPEPGWLRDAAAIVWSEVHRTRDDVDWPAPLREEIEKRIARHPFLAGYGFDDDERARPARTGQPGGP